MSSFVSHLNLIKTRRTRAWLTPSQQAALATLEKELQVSSTVNLFGGIGVGKTFLAWILADQLAYAYLPHPGRLEQPGMSEISGFVLDNCYYSRQVHRDLLKELRFRRINRAVLVTRRMIRDYTHYAELKLTPEDQTQVQQNLTSVGVVLARTDQPNLWHLVNPHL